MSRRHRKLLTALLLTGVLLWAIEALVPACAVEYPAGVQRYLSESPVAPEGFSALSLPELFGALSKQFQAQARSPFALARRLTAYLLLAAGVRALAGKFGQEQLSLILPGGFILLLLPTGTALCAALTEQAAQWSTYLSGFVPVYAGMVAASGNPSSALIYSGTFVGASSVLALLLADWMLPLIRIYFSLALAARLWGNEGASRAARAVIRLLRGGFKLLSVVLGLLLGTQSVLSAGADNLAMKAGRFLLANTIPIVGQTASDALGGVLAGLRLVKGYLAFAAIAAIFVSMAPVLAQCLMELAVLWLAAVLADGLGLPDCAGAASDLAEGVRLCLSALAVYFLLIFFSTIYMALLGG